MKQRIIPPYVYLRLTCYLLISSFILYFRPEVTAYFTSLLGQEYPLAFVLFFLFFQGMLAYAVGIIIHILLGFLLSRVSMKK